MGNEQSNARTTNYKKIKIVNKSTRTENESMWSLFPTKYFIDFELDEYIDYRTGSSRKITFLYYCVPPKTKEFFERIAEGDYLEIDLDRIKEAAEGRVFEFHRIEGTDYYDSVLGGIERRVADDGGLYRATRDYLQEVIDIRQRQSAAAEYSRWVAQTQSWTSYNLPPWK